MADYGISGSREQRAHGVYRCQNPECNRPIPWGALYTNYHSKELVGNWRGRRCLFCDRPIHELGDVSRTYSLARIKSRGRAIPQNAAGVASLEFKMTSPAGSISYIPPNDSPLCILTLQQKPMRQKSIHYEVGYGLHVVASAYAKHAGNKRKMGRYNELLREIEQL